MYTLRAVPCFLVAFLAIALMGCDSSEPDSPEDDPAQQITLDPSMTHQEMVGFGGALTWHNDRITRSNHRDEIAQLLFEDLGLDILRLKNWYYPTGYPEDKTPDEMEVNWFKPHFDATNELYGLAKQHNEDIDVLLSSWGPPSTLKSNGELEEGTLKRNEDGEFMYDAFAQYWLDMLDHISFTPEYLSIQNEPSYITDEWETSEWRPTETDEYPGYEEAIEHVHQQIQDRDNAPAFIGPESANIGNSGFGGNTFGVFAEVLQDKDYLDMYGYHLYNFSEGTSINQTTSNLRRIRDSYGDKPNIMTEYSGMSWMKTAQLINNTVVEANASGYIYWEMMWDQNSENAMVQVDDDLEYELTPFYYVVKHFAKHVNEGDERIDVSSDDNEMHVSGYKNPAGDRLTLIIVNPFNNQEEIEVEVADESIQGIDVTQSTEGNFYQEVSANPDEPLSVDPSSITTVVFEL